MTDFALTITASPLSTDQHDRAQRFGIAACAAGHRLTQVFFYHDGVLVSARSGFDHVQSAWEKLANAADCSLYLCVASAERRSIIECSLPWQIVGLGDWVEGLNADRHFHFRGNA